MAREGPDCMFQSLFGKGKKRKKPPAEDQTIRSAQVGDVVVIEGFSPTYEDAYFIIEEVNRYESRVAKWYELIGVDGERRVGIEWSDDDGLFVSVTEQDTPMGLTGVGISEGDLIRMDEEHSIDNSFEYEDQRYFYRNSQEVQFFKDNQQQSVGLYLWEFVSEDQDAMISVNKWEDVPFEVYASTSVSPDIVSVYKK